jgi:MarR family transcriptional regulator, lower aerobic nicotinate degradation pathway regulator
MTIRRAVSNNRNPPAAKAAEAASRHAGFLLGRAHQRFRQAIVDALDGSGLNPGQVAVLGALSAARGLSQSELTTVTGIEKSSMVLMIDALEAAGWVRRRPHETDRRAHALELTARGRQRLQAIGPRLQAAEDGLMAALTPAQRRTFLALLQRFVNGG